ncbi:arsenate reductase family protein [Spongiivirga citrea]|uniref:Arsenate reductase n=1 Tax=Spongiivirga citrea TaxID=1481457 RepID=A0A6M0CMD7_9FLAO|nr:ArsC/Spx/MgsR family protein [Spongiivirga citrea]NER17174.1 hypothetical protein [Spongiivirga citrea]
MKKIYHLGSCSTCIRIIKELNLPTDFILQDIKKEAITEAQLAEMKDMAGDYETLFSKRAQLFKQRDLKNQNLDESDFKNLILEHYTFLKRPVIIVDDKIFVGNNKSVVEAAKNAIH